MASKTARASAVKEVVNRVEIPDAERVRLIRIEVRDHIYPSCENAHALLRQYDSTLAALKQETISLTLVRASLAKANAEVVSLTASLAAANTKVDDLEAAQP